MHQFVHCQPSSFNTYTVDISPIHLVYHLAQEQYNYHTVPCIVLTFQASFPIAYLSMSYLLYCSTLFCLPINVASFVWFLLASFCGFC